MKDGIRQQVLAKRDLMKEGEVNEKSKLALERLYSLPEFKNAKGIMTYVSFRNEVDTEQLIRRALKMGTRIFIPKMSREIKEITVCELKDFDTELVCNHLGIKEPKTEFFREIEKDHIDLIIVPGVAFDSCGCRIGFGGGYYDKFILAMRKKVPLVALAFEFQVLDKLPEETHDQKVDLILTEKRIIHCNK